jgi:hypothetical protein
MTLAAPADFRPAPRKLSEIRFAGFFGRLRFSVRTNFIILIFI